MALITWKQGSYSERGLAGGVDLFSISWHTISSRPNWQMRTQLPALPGSGWESDDKGELKATAEKVLAAWLKRIQGEG
jgi:hypothetical protein